MADKSGSSSYKAGDTGGSYGDYHGVSMDWIASKVAQGTAKSSLGRHRRFTERMGAKAQQQKIFYGKHKVKAAASMSLFGEKMRAAANPENPKVKTRRVSR